VSIFFRPPMECQPLASKVPSYLQADPRDAAPGQASHLMLPVTAVLAVGGGLLCGLGAPFSAAFLQTVPVTRPIQAVNQLAAGLPFPSARQAQRFSARNIVATEAEAPRIQAEARASWASPLVALPLFAAAVFGYLMGPRSPMAMAGLFGNKAPQPGAQDVPSMTEMAAMVDKLGGPDKLQKAAKAIDSEQVQQLAAITKQMVNKGPESLSAEQQQQLVRVQLEMLTNLKRQGVTLPGPLQTLLDQAEYQQVFTNSPSRTPYTTMPPPSADPVPPPPTAASPPPFFPSTPVEQPPVAPPAPPPVQAATQAPPAPAAAPAAPAVPASAPAAAAPSPAPAAPSSEPAAPTTKEFKFNYDKPDEDERETDPN